LAVEVEAHKALPLYQALQVLRNGVVVLVVGAEKRHQLAIEAVADQFLVEAVAVVLAP